MDRKRFITSFFIAVIICLIIFSILKDFGITWDEPIYFVNGDRDVEWFVKPKITNRDKYFSVNVEDVHPPFRKIVSGITHYVLTTRLHILDNTSGYRISSLLFVFPFILLFSYIAIGQFGYAVGIVIPFLYSFLPHILFLTPLATMDYAITGMWFIVVITAVKGMKSFRWLIVSGVTVGLSLLTKLHGYLLFLPLIGYWFWYFKDALTVKRSRKRIKDALLRLGCLVVIPFVVYFIGWPWLWTSPVSHLTEYFRLQLVHGSIPEYVFGHTYTQVGWWYTPLMFLTTTPVFVLLFFFIGVGYTFMKGRQWDKLIFVNALYPIVFFSLPWVYRYDWIRLFLPAFPFICLITGRGIIAVTGLFRPLLRRPVTIIIILFWIITVFSSVVLIHPWESAYYNRLVGGISGASQLKLETEFWGNGYLGVLHWMNEHKNVMMCVSPTTNPFYYYQAMGQIEPGVVFEAGREACQYAVVLMRQGLFIQDPFIANVVLTKKPVYSVSVDGVSLVNVYNLGK